MNALQHGRQHITPAPLRPDDGRAFNSPLHQLVDWGAQVKLAVVLSAIAALTVAFLADRVPEPMLIVGVIVVASFIAWSRVEPIRHLRRQPARIHARGR